MLPSGNPHNPLVDAISLSVYIYIYIENIKPKTDYMLHGPRKKTKGSTLAEAYRPAYTRLKRGSHVTMRLKYMQYGYMNACDDSCR